MSIAGKWTGEYVYEETKDGGSRLVVGTVVSFTMELKDGWFGAITGTIKEDPETGFAEEGAIKGKLKGTVFVFEKIMPKLRMTNEKNRMSLDDIVERFNLVMDTDVKHPKIRHIGDLSADGNTIEGTWLSPEYQLTIPGSAQSIALPKLAGTFKMTRGS
jgi:hypothetical protein